MSEELSRVEDLLENGVEEPVLPMSELEAILRGEKIKPHSRVAELLLQYNPQDILIEKSITENGTYYASADNAAGYFKVIVDTPVVPPVVLDHLVETITQNGTYNYTSEHDGYSDADEYPARKALAQQRGRQRDSFRHRDRRPDLRWHPLPPQAAARDDDSVS